MKRFIYINMHRIAIINRDKCKPKKCNLECKNFCPVNSVGKQCITIEKESKSSTISEQLCIGCGICINKCPFNAIKIINIPKQLTSNITYRYGKNSFVLHGLPVPKKGKVMGLLGINGIGKSTCVQIFKGHLRPNFGDYNVHPSTAEIITHYRGSELQTFFYNLYGGNLKIVIKPQYVYGIHKLKIASSLVKDVLKISEKYISILKIEELLNKKIEHLSGGQLQLVMIAVSCSKDADMYIFDEPSSFLDVNQRMIVSNTIRDLCLENKYVIVVDHDLSILDYMSDYICLLYGVPSVYGVVTTPYSVADGINVFLNGFIPSENMRFRDYSLDFKFSNETVIADEIENNKIYTYPQIKKSFPNFLLHIQSGKFTENSITVLVGKNGLGKTTFVKLLCGILLPDGDVSKIDLNLVVSYKPQKIFPKYKGSVQELFLEKIKDNYLDPVFQSQIIKPMNIGHLLDHKIETLSGGELQKVGIIICIGKKADIYFLDEPSSYLDIEERINISCILRKYIKNNNKIAFIVEHDFLMTLYLADQIVVFSSEEGTKEKVCNASQPMSVPEGMNLFLEKMDITFRRDKNNFRPRINKYLSLNDQEQKKLKQYYL